VEDRVAGRAVAGSRGGRANAPLSLCQSRGFVRYSYHYGSSMVVKDTAIL
jgi:hypothetical protein